MNKVYFVRHGENLANITKEFSYKKVDYPLTPKGIMQAQQTAAYFKDKQIDEIYTSPLRRAVETAQIIAAELHLPVGIVEEFREINVGALEGQYVRDEHWQTYVRVVTAWNHGDHSAMFPDGEDYTTLLKRMQTGLVHIVHGKSKKNIIVVAHGGIFISTLKDICSGVDISSYRDADYHNCAISELEIASDDAGTLTVCLNNWGVCTHLSGDAADMVSGIPEPIRYTRS